MNRTGCCKYKSFDPTFSKVGGFLGQRPESRLASLETPKTSEKVPLFGTLHLLVNALLAKGEKVRMNGLEITMELSHFGNFSLVRQPHFFVYKSSHL